MAREECNNVPRQVPRQECEQEAQEVCSKVPREVCEKVPNTVCSQVPTQDCRDINREVSWGRDSFLLVSNHFSLQVCEQVPEVKCRNVPRQQCSPVCKPTYYCEVCQPNDEVDGYGAPQVIGKHRDIPS